MKNEECRPFSFSNHRNPYRIGTLACLSLWERWHSVSCDGEGTLSVSPHGLPAPPEGEPR